MKVLEASEGMTELSLTRGCGSRGWSWWKTLHDPHTWLDPEKAGEEAQIIADKLSEDSEHKETYQKCASLYQKAQELTKKFQPKFEKRDSENICNTTYSLSYLAKRFNESTWY